MKRINTLVIAALFAVLLGAGQVFAAACTCTQLNAAGGSTTATVPGAWVNCNTSNSAACTLTDALYNNGVSTARHLEFLNSCAHAVTIATSGGTAVANKGDTLQIGERQVYDIANGPCGGGANPQTSNCTNLLPHGTFSEINASAADTGCLNILEY